MSAVKTNVMRILDRAKVDYQPHFYKHKEGEAVDGVSVAAQLGEPVERVFKTLVTKGAHSYFVFVVPVAKELDLKAAARSVGEKSVEMIPVKEINKVTGYIRGGCSPIGMKKQYVTVIDTSAQLHGKIIVSGGKIGTQVELAPQTLAQLTGASFAEITTT